MTPLIDKKWHIKWHSSVAYYGENAKIAYDIVPQTNEVINHIDL